MSGYEVSRINDNFQKIQDAFNDKVLWRNTTDLPGEPNHFITGTHVDMNSNDILNVRNLTVLGDLRIYGYSLRELLRRMQELVNYVEEMTRRNEEILRRNEEILIRNEEILERTEDILLLIEAYLEEIIQYVADARQWAIYAWQAVSQISVGMRVAIGEGEPNAFRADFYDAIEYLTSDTLPVMVRAPFPNTSEDVTFQANETDPKPILLPSGEKPKVGDIQAETLMQWNTGKDAWILLNPQNFTDRTPYVIPGGGVNISDDPDELEIQTSLGVTELYGYLSLVATLNRTEDNTGPMTLKLDDSPAKFLLKPDNTPLEAGQIPATYEAWIFYSPVSDAWIISSYETIPETIEEIAQQLLSTDAGNDLYLGSDDLLYYNRDIVASTTELEDLVSPLPYGRIWLTYEEEEEDA